MTGFLLFFGFIGFVGLGYSYVSRPGGGQDAGPRTLGGGPLTGSLGSSRHTGRECFSNRSEQSGSSSRASDRAPEQARVKNCPSCSSELEQKTIDGITIEVCSTSCRGVWVERKELRSVMKSPPGLIELLESMSKEAPAEEAESVRYCPCCEGRELLGRKIDGVQVDQCEGCWGTWFDAGEVEAVQRPDASAGDFASQDNKELAEALSRAMVSMAKSAEATYDREIEEWESRRGDW